MTPWQILDIKAGSDRDSIRRAYARKLRGVNPEDDPQGFMRLRDAHDAAMAQLQWRQQWPDADDLDAADAPEEPVSAQDDLAASAPGLPVAVVAAPQAMLAEADGHPVALGEPDDHAAEMADLAARQQAFIAAIAAGPDGQPAALEHLLAAPALAGITARDHIEGWIAAAISARLPASDPLVVPAIVHFGWGAIRGPARGHDIERLLQRREEGEFIARIARPFTDLNPGYKALSRPPGPLWRARIGAMFGGAAGQTRQILGLADGPMPGIADWLNADALAFWRDWHSVPRLRLWMVLTMVPLAAAALVPVLAATGWPQPVQRVLALLAMAAPLGLLALLRFRQRFLADWDRPEWQFDAWLYAVPALPVLAAAWPPLAVLAPLWLLIVMGTLALVLVSVNQLLPDAPKTLMIGLVRALPAWFALAVVVLGAPLAGWAQPVLSLLLPAMAILWWQGGDDLAWTVQRRLGPAAPWWLTGAAAFVASNAGGLLLGAVPDADLAARGLALMTLALLLALAAFRLLTGWAQLVPLVLMAALLVVAAAGLEGLQPRGRASPRAAMTPPATIPPQALGTVDQWLDAGPLLRGQPPGAYRFVVEITVDPRGRVNGCLLVQGTGVAALDQALCPQLQAKARYRPALTPDGVPEAAGLRLSGGWTLKERAQATAPPVPAPDLARDAAMPPPARVPQRRAEPVISCPPAAGSGPMVAEPCMRGAWIGSGDYPAAALAQGQRGTVGYRLLVDTAGRVARCDVVDSSGHAALDTGTCDLIARRARFVPARGVDGAPMEWTYRSAVDWAINPR